MKRCAWDEMARGKGPRIIIALFFDFEAMSKNLALSKGCMGVKVLDVVFRSKAGSTDCLARMNAQGYIYGSQRQSSGV